MTEQNSTVEHQIRPTVLQDQLGIKKDAYYAYLKHLGITAEKDSTSKAFLNSEQENLIRALRKHVVAGGKIEAFKVDEQPVALAVADGGELGQVTEHPVEEINPAQGLDMEALYLEASELAAQRLTAGQQVVMAMASRMTYEDLHPTAKAKVDHVRTVAVPKFNAQEVAENLLNQCRQQMQVA
ncbi:hypothetical protein [Adonisia turfae]|uniref:Uncharacterized protein n=1 Tax=Adonisia turfae CCMR0081 TaxID=2292702 RepID=A0A6M0RER8_9CYAN|nr:hypothetical protein [Adonisia turfae]NEZ54252.1 hypothetical protein [Adonisia turfae CCMR0081]